MKPPEFGAAPYTAVAQEYAPALVQVSGYLSGQFSDQHSVPAQPTQTQQPQQQQAVGTTASQFPAVPASEQQRPVSLTTVYVGNLPTPGTDANGQPSSSSGFDESMLYNYFFSSCGSIKGIRTHANRGFAFIEFDNEQSAANAVGLNNTSICLNPAASGSLTKIHVKYAHQRQPGRGRFAAYQQQQQDLGSLYDPNYGSAGGLVSIGGYAGLEPSGISAEHMMYGTTDDQAMYYTQDGYYVYSGDVSSEALMAGQAAGTSSHFVSKRWRPRLRSPSPPAIPRYSDAEARTMKDLLKNCEDSTTFIHACQTISSWLEAGECSKRTADTFYVYLQLIHGRTKSFKDQEEQRKAQREAEDKLWAESLTVQLDLVQNAFKAAGKQRVRDLFSKTQRKLVDQWATFVTDITCHYHTLAHRDQPGEDGDQMDLGEDKVAEPPILPSSSGVPHGAASAAATAAAAYAPPPPPPVKKRAQTSSSSSDDEAPHDIHQHHHNTSHLEQVLESRTQQLNQMTVKVASLEVQLAAARNAANAGAALPSSLPSSVLASPLTACVTASISVLLAAHPQGASLPAMTQYVAQLVSGGGAKVSEATLEKAGALVSQVLNSGAGAFRRSDSGLGEPLWQLSAYTCLSQLFAAGL